MGGALAVVGGDLFAGDAVAAGIADAAATDAMAAGLDAAAADAVATGAAEGGVDAATGDILSNAAGQQVAKAVVSSLMPGGKNYSSGKGSSGGMGGSSGGTDNQGFLDSTPEMLHNQGGDSYKGGLETVDKGSILSPQTTASVQDNINPALESSGNKDTLGLDYSGGLTFGGGGGVADDIKKDSCIFSSMSKVVNNLKPEFVCSRAEMLHPRGQSSGSSELKPLKHIYSGISTMAMGGLPHKYAAAAPKGHNPEFITGMTGYYACGVGTGQSDDIPAMLHDGDYVMDAETVSALGDGSSKAGREVLDGFRTQIPHHAEGGTANPVPAKIADGEYVFPAAFVTALGAGDNKRGSEILDGLRTRLRAHKRGAPLDKIPPKAKDPMDYIKKGSK